MLVGDVNSDDNSDDEPVINMDDYEENDPVLYSKLL